MEDINSKNQYTGTLPVPADEVHTAPEYNDRRNELQNAVADIGLTGGLDSADTHQLSKSMFANGVAAQSMLDNSVSANLVQLTPITGASNLRVATPVAVDYSALNGAIFNFKAANTNTGNMTVNLGQTLGTLIGVQSLFLEDGVTQVVAGLVVSGQYYSIRYNSGGFFVLLGVGNYIKLVDSKATGVDGGTFTSGAWRKRTVTEEVDEGNNVSVSSSVIVLAPGTYRCMIHCPAVRAGLHQARLRNTTDGVTVLVGTSEQLGGTIDSSNRSFIVGTFTIATSKNLEIQHRCGTTRSADGFGRGNNFGENNIYTVAEFWKKRS